MPPRTCQDRCDEITKIALLVALAAVTLRLVLVLFGAA